MIGFKNVDFFTIVIKLIICSSVLALFLSIFIDFTLYTKSEKVKKEKKSIVETGTMTLFFFIFYFILKSGIGVMSVPDEITKKILAAAGTLIIVVGCGINIKGRFNLGKNWGNHIKIYEDHTLVQSGMYKFVRHPLYASIIFMFYGACLVYRNIFCFLSVTFIFVPFMVYRGKQEEKLLLQFFSEYREYKEKTGMFIPKIVKRKK